jgi:hypothetical protein
MSDRPAGQSFEKLLGLLDRGRIKLQEVFTFSSIRWRRGPGREFAVKRFRAIAPLSCSGLRVRSVQSFLKERLILISKSPTTWRQIWQSRFVRLE